MSEEQQAVEPSESAGLLDGVEASDSSQQDPQAAAQQTVEHRDAASIPDDEPLERPEFWPENFWNKDTNEPDLEGIAKSWMDLRKMVSQGKHKAPPDGKYDTSALAYVEDISQDPLANYYVGWAQKHGISQAAFDELAAEVNKMAMDGAPAPVDIAAEKKALGANADATINGMVNWARGLVNKGVWSAEDFEEFKVMGGTAKGMKALMKIREAYEGRIPIESQPMEGAMSDAELQSMIGNVNDPNNPYVKDPAYRAKVERLFSQRYAQ